MQLILNHKRWSFMISIIVGIPSIIDTYKRNQQLKADKK